MKIEGLPPSWDSLPVGYQELLLRKKTRRAGRDVKHIVETQDQRLRKYVDGLFTSGPAVGSGDYEKNDPFQMYEDLNHILLDCYVEEDPYVLLTMSVPRGVRREHEYAVQRCLERQLKDNQALVVEGAVEESVALSDQSLKLICSALQKSKGELKEIVLSRLGLADKQLEVLLQDLPLERIEKLDLSHNAIGPRGAELLAKRFGEADTPVGHIVLSHNAIGETGVVAFMPCVSTKSLILELVGVGVDEEVLERLHEAGEDALSSVSFKD